MGNQYNRFVLTNKRKWFLPVLIVYATVSGRRNIEQLQIGPYNDDRINGRTVFISVLYFVRSIMWFVNLCMLSSRSACLKKKDIVWSCGLLHDLTQSHLLLQCFTVLFAIALLLWNQISHVTCQTMISQSTLPYRLDYQRWILICNYFIRISDIPWIMLCFTNKVN